MEEWDNEPDRLEWEYCGFKCSIVRHPEMKHLCGYVGLPKSHPYYGKHYNQCLLGRERWDCTWYKDHPSLEKIIKVHGGLTFSQQGDGETWEKDLWWLGFDCAHTGDLVPGRYEKYGRTLDGVYRNMEYVKKETEQLAEQLTSTAIAERAFENE